MIFLPLLLLLIEIKGTLTTGRDLMDHINHPLINKSPKQWILATRERVGEEDEEKCIVKGCRVILHTND